MSKFQKILYQFEICIPVFKITHAYFSKTPSSGFIGDQNFHKALLWMVDKQEKEKRTENKESNAKWSLIDANTKSRTNLVYL